MHNKIKGKNIYFKLVEVEDADFILKLRTNPVLNKHISLVKDDIKLQIEWITKYKEREYENKEYYFIIYENKTNKKIGTIRVYQIEENSCVWGSFIFLENLNPLYSIEAVIMNYDFIFFDLKKEIVNFDVRKSNKQVLLFHKKFGASLINEDELNYYFCLTKNNYQKIRNRFNN